jgi:hypothetical protein
MFNGRRQPSCGGTSRMTRECQVRFCEGLGVKSPEPTRHSRRSANCWSTSGIRTSDMRDYLSPGHHVDTGSLAEILRVRRATKWLLL